MADLSKMGEVRELYSGGHSAEELVNKYLKKGWQLLTVKVIETQFRVHESDGKDHIHKAGATHYVLGKPRSVRKQ